MSYLQESAEACERLLKKSEASLDKMERLRVTPADLAAARRLGFTVGYRRATAHKYPAVLKTNRSGRFKEDYMASSRVAAREWLDQPKPRTISQEAIGKKYGVSQAAVCIAVNRERKNRRKAHLAGDRTALLATQRRAA